MAIIIRSSKPKVIKRSPREPVVGSGWPIRPGYPHDAGKRQYHLLSINGVRHVWLWEPESTFDSMWSVELYRCSPGIMSAHGYVGVCSPVYRSPTTPTDEEIYRRFRR